MSTKVRAASARGATRNLALIGTLGASATSMSGSFLQSGFDLLILALIGPPEPPG